MPKNCLYIGNRHAVILRKFICESALHPFHITIFTYLLSIIRVNQITAKKCLQPSFPFNPITDFNQYNRIGIDFTDLEYTRNEI